jgi:acetyltransferase-like isoleucine patch superfamily enzyme
MIDYRSKILFSPARTLSRIFRLTIKKVCSLHVIQKNLVAIWEESKKEKLLEQLASYGERVYIHWPVTITSPQQVLFGDDVSLAAYVHIWGEGGVRVGNRVMIGTHSSIASVTHDYTQRDMYHTLIEKEVVIEDDVWVGSSCVILPGVRVGKGAVLGAGSVVTKDVPAGVIMAGVPAKVLKSRFVE